MRILALGATALALALGSQAPAGASGPARTQETKHLQVTTSVTRVKGHVSLVAAIAPKPTMHVYAPGQPGLIGVTIALEGVKGTLKYPAPEKRVIAGETELVYSKPFRIMDAVTLPSGTTSIKGTLRYQACDDAICYLPTTVPLEWTVK